MTTQSPYFYNNSKGNRNLIYNGYEYWLKNELKEDRGYSWKCASKDCGALLYTNKEDVVIDDSGKHVPPNHPKSGISQLIERAVERAMAAERRERERLEKAVQTLLEKGTITTWQEVQQEMQGNVLADPPQHLYPQSAAFPIGGNPVYDPLPLLSAQHNPLMSSSAIAIQMPAENPFGYNEQIDNTSGLLSNIAASNPLQGVITEPKLIEHVPQPPMDDIGTLTGQPNIPEEACSPSMDALYDCLTCGKKYEECHYRHD